MYERVSLVCLVIIFVTKIYAIGICCSSDSIIVEYNSHPGLDDFPQHFGVLDRIQFPKGYGLENWNKSLQCASYTFLNTSQRREIPLYLGNSSCLALINSSFIACTCNSNNNESLQSLGFINKCCPHGYTYSSELKKCNFAEVDFQIYSSIFDSPVVFFDKSFNCPNNRVIVEYTVSAKEVTFSANFLTWKDGTKKFKKNDFCIEALNGSSNNNHSTYIIQNQTNHHFLIRVCDELKICDSLTCIRRCCADGEMYVKRNVTTICQRDESDIQFHSLASLDINGNFIKPSVFGVMSGLDCPKFRLDPDFFSDEAHIISSSNGSLIINGTKKMYTNNQYCIEKIQNSTSANQKLYTFVCFDSNVVGSDRIRFKMYPVGLLISCCFYAATLLVYISISKLRNLPGKILISLVSSLFLAYLGIALGQLWPTSNDDICFISGFSVYFCLMAAFSWMNITCFDIWQTFGSTKTNHLDKQRHQRRFIWYSLYGWGMPTLLTAITVSLTKLDVLPDKIRPKFGHGRCWFTYDTIGSASLLFFSGPVGLLFLINLALFVLTLKYCNKVKREIYRMQSSNCDKPILRSRFFIDKTRFVMNAKLCFVMGITWLLEIASILFYDHKKTFFWSISDSFNVLLGVFVFFIFVFKRRIWLEILMKLGFRQEIRTPKNRNTCVTQSSYAAISVSMKNLKSPDGSSALMKHSTNVNDATMF